MRRLLEALDHVHAARIVHRDVKPANVLMGRDGRARLTDFGIAQPEDATQLTQAGGVMGTMRYLAPEVLGGEPATPVSDLYALGMLMRDCLEPGEGALGTLAERLTAPDPADRPQSAAAALALLDEEPTAALDEGPIADDPATEATRRMPRVPRPALPEPRELPDGRREYELARRRPRGRDRARRARRRDPRDRHRRRRRRRLAAGAAAARRVARAPARRPRPRGRRAAVTPWGGRARDRPVPATACAW